MRPVCSSESMKEAFPIGGRGGARSRRYDPGRASCSQTSSRCGRGMPQSVRAQAMRFRARMAAADGDEERADRLFRGAASLLRELATPFPMAVVTA